jgi:aminoglycoside phosphotransferase (APT) family kinase protein
MNEHVEAFVAKRWSLAPGSVRVELEPLHGGLESSVALATVTTSAPSAHVPMRLVVKQLAPAHRREVQIYESLLRQLEAPPAPVAFGCAQAGDAVYLYLEHVTVPLDWPWVDTATAAAVCRELARLHDSAQLADVPGDWDYEAELAASAVSTLALALTARDEAGQRFWRRLGDLKRVVSSLPWLREILLASGRTVIHGDVHPGNVLLRAQAPRQVTLIDWSRARAGSPLEDVASWLHSLGCWEPQARLRHDSLLRAYLSARRVPPRLEATLRRDYWLAAASNALAGAIRYHLSVAGDQRLPDRARQTSRRVVAEWERVIRRAAALLSTSHERCGAAASPALRSST